ncbi:MAG TPA: DUF5691 domain-containing protein, partial [Longimicrobium sp.]|nr:DUF5691 domain-containing protein [Longimicrobium sp.]
SAAPPAEPAPQGEERICSPVAARVLRQLLAGGPPPLLAEWMGLAANVGAAIPHELLPAVLDFGARHAAVRDDITRALGPRGTWLAAQNPAWTFSTEITARPESAWETGTAEERIRILRHVRSTDSSAGLALLQSTWETDPPRDRAQFVEALENGLSMDDEPLLESALDDKRKEVRTAAARLLGTLPESRLVRRMTERLAPLLRVHTPEGMIARLRGAGPRIDVELPAACDKAMRRDGIEPKPIYGFGERAWWLHQMLAAVPPSFWTAHWGMDAAALLNAARANKDDGHTLVGGWTQAALHNRDPEWAEALLRTGSDGEVAGALVGLAGALTPERLEPLVLARLRPGGLLVDRTSGNMLDAARFAWSPALTRAVLDALPREIGADRYQLREWLRGFAMYMHPATAVATLRELGDPHEGTWVDLLHLRHTLHQAFE